MSLLNDMLRDLSHQHPASAVINHDSNELLQQTRLVKSPVHSWTPAIIIFIVVFLSVLAINYGFHKYSEFQKVKALSEDNSPLSQTKSKVDSQQDKSMDANNHAPAAFEQNTRSPAQPVAAQENTDNKNIYSSDSDINATGVKKNAVAEAGDDIKDSEIIDASSPVPADKIAIINELMAKANRALAMDRLTSPIEDNAYSYYQKILALDSNHSDAIKGLELIAARYLIKAREQELLGNNQQALTLIERARFVARDYADIHMDTSLIAIEKQKLPAEVEFHPQPIDDHGNINPEDLNSQQQSRMLPSNKTDVETVKSFDVKEATPMTVVPNAGWKDEQMARQARDLMQQGKIAEAQLLLKNFIVTEKQPIQSTLLLSEIYFQQNNIQAIQIILSQTNYLPEVEKAKMEAQLLSLQNKNSEALEVLERHLNAADNNESYRALLAGLYHKTGNYQKSVINYQRLLTVYGEKPAYWLGVALAYDGLGQNNNALQAYLRLHEFPQLQEQVKTYIEQRITALRGQ